MAEIYISTDIEADGPIPGPHSMLSIGAVAFDESGSELGSFSANLETLEGASPDPDTMAWWAQHPEAWKRCRENLRRPAEAMQSFVSWVATLDGQPVFVAYPAGFDFTFVYWYSIRFLGESPFSFSALDIKSFFMALRGIDFRDSTKRNMPLAWFVSEHSHVAEEDAREQGILFINMLKESRKRT